MKLRHPNGKRPIETDNPQPYLTQGWVEVKPVKSEKSDDK